MSETHPVMLAYDQTKNTEIPLILVVGREPNNGSGISISSVADIPFRNFSRCGLWNLSFKIIADSLNETHEPKELFNTSIIKSAFENRHACPIIITDASPISIENKVKNKLIIRKAISENEFDLHIERIFNQETLLKRVKIVIFSGLDNFEYFKAQFEKKAKENKYDFPILKLPFFHGLNSKRIKDGLKNHQDIITDVAKAFINLPTKLKT